MSNPPLKKEWELTPAAFEKFLSAFGPNREQAGYEYERLRHRLVKLFEWDKCLFPEEGADETINRVIRKLDDGEVIENLQAYSTSVARNGPAKSGRGRTASGSSGRTLNWSTNGSRLTSVRSKPSNWTHTTAAAWRVSPQSNAR
jgi:hypothetical protein